MTVTVTGEGPTILHVRTGLFSLDVAWGKRRTHELGMPLRSIHHIYGHPETGKNTLAFYLAGCIQPAGKVVYIALESSDRDYVADASAQSGFHGEVQYAKMMDGEKHRAHADVLDDVRKQVLLEPGSRPSSSTAWAGCVPGPKKRPRWASGRCWPTNIGATWKAPSSSGRRPRPCSCSTTSTRAAWARCSSRA